MTIKGLTTSFTYDGDGNRVKQGAAGLSFLSGSVNNFLCPPVTGALEVIGLGGRASL